MVPPSNFVTTSLAVRRNRLQRLDRRRVRRPRHQRLLAARPVEEPPELYCQVLEHKWYLSERAQGDVGLKVALEDYLVKVPSPPPPTLGEPEA